MLSALIGVLIIVVIGAICFWAIDKFAVDRRLSQLLKLLVVLICIAAILQRVLPLLGVELPASTGTTRGGLKPFVHLHERLPLRRKSAESWAADPDNPHQTTWHVDDDEHRPARSASARGVPVDVET